MIKLSRLADYAVVLLTQMAANPKGVNTALDLAVLTSVRGAKGGYRLAVLPERLSVARIIAAIDGPIALTQCVETEGLCNVESLCPTRDGWHRINEAVEKALAGVSLAELSTPSDFSAPPLPAAVPALERGSSRE
jgi:DNA-binding IscR family transcriptional regulator